MKERLDRLKESSKDYVRRVLQGARQQGKPIFQRSAERSQPSPIPSRTVFNSRTAKVVLFFLGGCLFLVSLFGLYIGITTPAQEEVTVPEIRYEQQGEFNYTIYLKPNSLFETNELGPGQPYITRLVDNAQMTFNYRFSSDQSLEGARFVYRVNATFGSNDLWKREFVLVPPTSIEKEDFKFSFAPPIPQAVDLMDTYQRETGMNMQDPELTVTVRVAPQVAEKYGISIEPFEQSLRFSFSGETISVADPLNRSQPGATTITIIQKTPGLEAIRAGSILGGLVSILLMAYLGWSFTRPESPIPTAEKELLKAKKKYRELMVQAEALPSARPGQVVIRLSSLNDMVKLSQETLRPVIYQQSNDRIDYCLIDGAGVVRYEFSSKVLEEEKSYTSLPGYPEKGEENDGNEIENNLLHDQGAGDENTEHRIG